MKRKTLTLTLCLLATLALASIGFASWIIANPYLTVDGTQEGSFTVYTAVDESITVDVEFTKNSTGEEVNQIIFGKPSANDIAAIENPWLTIGDDIEEENLSVTFTATATNAEKSANGLEVLLYVDAATYAKLDAAKEAGVIGYSEGQFVELKNGETVIGYGVREDLTSSVTLDLVFEWGFEFGGRNPFLHYNSRSYTADAATKLNQLAELNGIKFNILVQEKAETAE